jgi:hypothetical protein
METLPITHYTPLHHYPTKTETNKKKKKKEKEE